MPILNHRNGPQGIDQMNTYTLTVMDCVSGYTKIVRVEASTREEAIYKVESDPKHEYEVIEFDD